MSTAPSSAAWPAATHTHTRGNAETPRLQTQLSLNAGWSVRSSAELSLGNGKGNGGDGAMTVGQALSQLGVDTAAWRRVDLPSTVLGALVTAGEIVDPFFGSNLAKIPGQGPEAKNFSNFPMPEDSPFRQSWWFRKELSLPPEAGPHASLQFDGINYRANIWLNGHPVAGRDQVAGAYREYEFDVTLLLHRDRPNVIAVEVFPPDPCDLALTWVDWNPSPPDKNMGLWRDVWLRTSGPVAVRAPFVVTKLEGTNGSVRAHLTIAGDLVNVTDRPQLAEVRAALEAGVFTKRFEVPARARVSFAIDPTDDPALLVEQPRLWWPHTIGTPNLYDLNVQVTVGGHLSDEAQLAFGIREITSAITSDGHTRFFVNGVPLLIRGAGWASDLFLRRQPERDRIGLRYAKAMNLNAIRFEGMLERSEFLEQCDREGILVIAGWCCCDCWEKWETWTDENHVIAPQSLRSQLRRARRHPSLLTWWYGSDFPPPAHVEQRYLEVLREERWPNPFQSSASQKPGPVTGPSGLKMLGPYDWVPPSYWLEDIDRGGAFGFATEINPGPAIPPVESLKKMLPPEHHWPIDDAWNFHAGGQAFHNIVKFTEALNARYGTPASIDEFAELSQLMTYEAQRAMFEGYARNRSKATGVVQWMLNNAWPSLMWHLYDHYLRAGGGYFGTKKACEPLHVMYAYDDGGVVVINDRIDAAVGLRVEARLISSTGRTLRTEAHLLMAEPISATTVCRLSPPPGEDVYFVDLRLLQADGQREGGQLVSRNFYWLAPQMDVLDRANTNWMHTPTKSYADLTALRRLPRASLTVSVEPPERVVADAAGDHLRARVQLHNPSDHLAFFVQLRLCDGQGNDVLPVVWSDNYVSLLPGETTVVRVELLGGAPARGTPLFVEARGLNVDACLTSLTR
ncbi:MAG: exo,4-beta-D-glucosaminidase [Myxococcales bacterium]|nr:exo,4-beta-D-glucosaminidase [Myxococcales bacterium]